MSMPVKLSDELVLSARREAALVERSITAQIEYWAKLGRALERALSHAEVLAISATHGAADNKLVDAFPEPAQQRSVRAVMQAVLASSERSAAQAIIHASGQPVYESDPQRPGGVIQVAANGKRVAGYFEQRRFVPDKVALPKTAKRAKTSQTA